MSMPFWVLWDHSHLWGLLLCRGLAALGAPFAPVTCAELASGALWRERPRALLVPGGALQTPPLCPASVSVCNHRNVVQLVHAAASLVAGNTAVTTPLFASLLTLAAPATVKKFAATPSSL